MTAYDFINATKKHWASWYMRGTIRMSLMKQSSMLLVPKVAIVSLVSGCLQRSIGFGRCNDQMTTSVSVSLHEAARLEAKSEIMVRLSGICFSESSIDARYYLLPLDGVFINLEEGYHA